MSDLQGRQEERGWLGLVPSVAVSGHDHIQQRVIVDTQGYLFDEGGRQYEPGDPALPWPYCPSGPPEGWALNEYGQPQWLLPFPHSQKAGWGVIVPPKPDLAVPNELVRARAQDREWQGLDEWGAGSRNLAHVLELGPASMPAITWDTPPPDRAGYPGLEWTQTETAVCAAWLHDIRGWSRPKIASRLINVPPASPSLEKRALRRRANRYLEAGRQGLCDQGVWPWISVPSDRVDDVTAERELPERWWEDLEVLAFLEVWNLSTVRPE